MARSGTTRSSGPATPSQPRRSPWPFQASQLHRRRRGGPYPFELAHTAHQQPPDGADRDGTGAVDGYAAPAPMPTQNLVSPIEQADALLAASGATITHEGARAYYRPSTDSIVLPPREAFTGTATMTATEAYYATALHELVHWTGPRLERDLANRFGTEAYAAEELVAELGAAFLCADLGVSTEPREDHAAYLASWAKLLRDDRKAFTTAAAKAAQASDYLLAFIAPQEQAEAA